MIRTLLFLLSLSSFESRLYDRVYMHDCEYEVTFTATHAVTDRTQSETITITVRRPVDFYRIKRFWLTSNLGADINEDDIVNFGDYAIWNKYSN